MCAFTLSGDLYVHADLHGATSCVIKNPSGKPFGFIFFRLWRYSMIYFYSFVPLTLSIFLLQVTPSLPVLWLKRALWLSATVLLGMPRSSPALGGFIIIRWGSIGQLNLLAYVWCKLNPACAFSIDKALFTKTKKNLKAWNETENCKLISIWSFSYRITF